MKGIGKKLTFIKNLFETEKKIKKTKKKKKTVRPSTFVILLFIYDFLKFFTRFEVNEIFLAYFNFFSSSWVAT